MDRCRSCEQPFKQKPYSQKHWQSLTLWYPRTSLIIPSHNDHSRSNTSLDTDTSSIFGGNDDESTSMRTWCQSCSHPSMQASCIHFSTLVVSTQRTNPWKSWKHRQKAVAGLVELVDWDFQKHWQGLMHWHHGLLAALLLSHVPRVSVTGCFLVSC